MKKTTLILLVTLFASHTYAQHEISAYGMGGYPSLMYKTNGIEGADLIGSAGYGYGFGLDYASCIDDMWAVRMGIEMSSVGAQFTAPILTGGFATTARADDDADVGLVFNSRYINYRETQRAVYVNLPIMGQWNTSNSGYVDFYAQAGVKLGVAIGGTYRLTADTLVTTCNIPDLWATLTSENSNHNLGTQTGIDQKGTLSFGLNIAVAAEVGVKWTLAEQCLLYTGVYADYGVLNIAPKASGALVTAPLDSKADFTYNSVLNATTGGARYVDKVNLPTVGIKIRIAYGIE